MSRGSILIVDDEPYIRLTLKKAIDRLGVETDTAVNAEEALERLKTGHYNLLLLDLHLPGMSGMTALELIKEQHEHLPVVVLTAFGSVDRAVEAMKNGASDFIEKPISHQELINVLLKYLEPSAD